MADEEGSARSELDHLKNRMESLEKSTEKAEIEALKTQLKKLEETDVAGIVTRLNSKETIDTHVGESLKRALEFKDNIITGLTASNSALNLQLTSRWDFFKTMMSLITLLFSAAFVWQLVRAQQIEDLHTSLDQDFKILKVERRIMQLEAQNQANTVAALLKASTLLHNGYRDSQRGRHGSAIEFANKALAEVKRLEETAQQVSKVITDESAGLERGQGRLSQQLVFVPNLLQPFQATIEEVRYSCYDLQGRSYFLSKPSDTQRVAEIGNQMIDLNKRRWEGYHWRGLGLGDVTSKNLHSVTPQEANPIIEAYRQSLFFQPTNNMDRLNLAEILFAAQQWGQAEEEATRFMTEQPFASDDQKILSHFFLTVSRYMLGQSSLPPRKDLEAWISNKKAWGGKLKPDWSNYSFTVLGIFRKDIQGSATIQVDKKRDVQDVLDWFLKFEPQ